MSAQSNNFIIDFIGVGAPKCGTTWIAQCLSEHPQICLSRPKEVNYFNKYNIGLPNTINKKHTNNIKRYFKHFAHCAKNQLKGEFSTHYLYDNEAPKLIARHFPNIKIIICLRNPIDRLYSHFLHFKYQTGLKRQNKKLPNFKKTLNQYPNFIKTGFYAQYIKNYLKYFNQQNIYIIFYEEIKNSPQETIKKLYDFLEVDTNFLPLSINKNTNPTSKKIKTPLRYNFLILKNRLMHCWLKKKTIKIIKKIGLNKIILKLFINPMNQITKRLSQNKTSYPPMDKKTRKYLQKIYEPHIKELEKMLSVDLSSWKK